MKLRISVILGVILLVVFSLFNFKGLFGNIIVDKTGMVRFPEDDIILCRYSSGGGMEGESEILEIRESENGCAFVTYEYSCITTGEEYSKSAEVTYEALSEIRAICKKYKIFSWGELKDSEIIFLDGPVTSVTVSTGDTTYTYNSNQEIPENALGITSELYNVMNNYLKGVD